jgi:hypothetical protein
MNPKDMAIDRIIPCVAFPAVRLPTSSTTLSVLSVVDRFGVPMAMAKIGVYGLLLHRIFDLEI